MIAELFRKAAEEALFDSIPREMRNRYGQFSTPYELARQITSAALEYCPAPKRILEPACGTGAFISAVRSAGMNTPIDAIELNADICNVAKSIWENTHTAIYNEDFLEYAGKSTGRFDLILSNPPYTRHQFIPQEKKREYVSLVCEKLGGKLSSLAGLHAYFILLGQMLLAPGGVAAWLIPAEFFSLNYAKPIKEFLLNKQQILRLHFFDSSDLMFSEALVSSCVIIVKNAKPDESHKILVTQGDFEHVRMKCEVEPSFLKTCGKWQHIHLQGERRSETVLGDYFTVTRGIATGNNTFFVKSLSEWNSLGVEPKYLCPLIPPPRNFKKLFYSNVGANSDASSAPYLLSISSDEEFSRLPVRLAAYLNSASDSVRAGYIVSKRKKWYSVEVRKSAPIVCTYMGRSNSVPFRFIRNRTQASILNTYLALYPKKTLSEQALDRIWERLNSLSPESIISCCREYGGGLKKLEPKELLSLPFSI